MKIIKGNTKSMFTNFGYENFGEGSLRKLWVPFQCAPFHFIAASLGHSNFSGSLENRFQYMGIHLKQRETNYEKSKTSFVTLENYQNEEKDTQKNKNRKKITINCD